ncbi:hypothetical protein P7H75_14020 [Vagococcus carniphilus]|uniref:hypothetical protein n=1 Tax=Vagococcus carniphilus TaxID=218144 RepID=UPI00288E7432|nr:hypothetical protein [Vagococcus carniphilus]MDT2815972.1 hypothetical protein [Vagococcus carniphilus]
MAKYKVLQKFRDIKTDEVYEVGSEITMNVSRAEEVEKNLEKYDGSFLERTDNKPATDQVEIEDETNESQEE